MSDKYSPEVWFALFVLIRNVVLIITCGSTICFLYYWSRSWHCLWPLLMLGFLAGATFIRD